MNRGLTTIALLCMALLAGCLSPTSRDKGTVVANAEFLKDKHFEITCKFFDDAFAGIHAKLDDCEGGHVVVGKIEAATAEYEGLDDSSGGFHNRHDAQISTGVYYASCAGGGNDMTEPNYYKLNGGDEGAFSVKVAFPLDKCGPGTYQIRFVANQYRECDEWWQPGYRACPIDAMTAIKDVKITTEGGWT